MIFNRKHKEKKMSEQEKQEQQTNSSEEQVILENENPTSNENNIDNADEIKSRIEGDINNVNEKAAEKDWASELKIVEDKYLRLYAEFDNFKRRTATERLELFRTANQETLVAMLPILDDFERAMKSIKTATDIDAVKGGIELVSGKLKNILTQKGLKQMESIGKEFDSEFHEAVTNIPAPTEELKGKVVDVLENGYFLNDKVVRFAKVVVGE
jgi:molecular chaperone GrpE